MLIKPSDKTVAKDQVNISVVIPVYSDFRIAECLEALCQQNFSGFYEIIVVENDGRQLLRRVIESYPVKYLCCPKPGSYSARNMGIEATRGEIVVFTDADCIPDLDYLDTFWKVFAGTDVDILAGQIINVPGDSKVQTCRREFLVSEGLQYLRPISPLPYAPTGNVAFRRRVLNELDGFDTQFLSGGDVDLSWRAQQAGYSVIFLPDAIVRHQGRTSLKNYFRQFYKYGIGQVLLFKKHKKMLNKKLVFNDYPFRGLIQAVFFGVTVGIFRLFWKRDWRYLWSRFLDVIEHTALLISALVGSLRYRVLYI